jgi:hypothetical protein
MSSRQKPQNTRVCGALPVAGVAVQVTGRLVTPTEGYRRVMVPADAEAGGGQSWLVGNAAPSELLPGAQAIPLFGPPMHVNVLVLQIGHGWMPGTAERLSPVRKTTLSSVKAASISPVEQSSVPVGVVDTVRIAQALVGVLTVLGIGNGAPKRHPTLVQVRMLPVSAGTVGPSVAIWFEQLVIRKAVRPRSGTVAGNGIPLLPPPK